MAKVMFDSKDGVKRVMEPGNKLVSEGAKSVLRKI